MKFPRSRWIVRAMLVAVLLVPIAVVAVILKRRADEFGRRAELHARLGRPGGGGSFMGNFDEAMREIKVFENYHISMHKKYAYLKQHPWLSADPDPPPPTISFEVQ